MKTQETETEIRTFIVVQKISIISELDLANEEGTTSWVVKG